MNDIARAHIKGAETLRQDAVELAGTGALIIHGFGGGRAEVAPLAEFLQGLGLRVCVPLLPGHEEGRGGLRRISRRHWLAEVEESYKELSGMCERIYVIGFSMGGLLAVQLLAARFPGVNLQNGRLGGLVTVNTPVYYWNWRQMAVNLLKGRARERSLYRKKYFSSGAGLPLRAMAEFQMLLSGTKGLYSRLCCRALVIQMADDDTVWPASGDYILRRMNGVRRLVKLPTGGHQAFQGEGKAQACHAIRQFIQEGESKG